MLLSELRKFISHNDQDMIKDYYTHLLDKQKNLSKSNERVLLYMILILFVYYLASNGTSSTVSLPFVTLDNKEAIKLFSPLIFNVLLLINTVIIAHQIEISKPIKIIGSHIFKLTFSHNLSIVPDLLRFISPFSFRTEAPSKITRDKTSIVSSIFMIIPTMVVSFAPFVFEYYVFENYCSESWQKGWLEKITIVLNGWFFVSSIVVYYNLFVTVFREFKMDARTLEQPEERLN